MNGKGIRTVIISRTDAIGDVVLTLPLAELIKEVLGRDVKVIFFGRSYTYPVISCSDVVDGFIDYDVFKTLDKNGQTEFLKVCNADAIIHVFPRGDIARAAKRAGIANRIGTTNRLYHWLTCNRLIRLSRKNSPLHESQLNVRLMKGIGHSGNISLNEIPPLYHLNKIKELPERFSSLLSKEKFNLVIHPKSNASAREWSMDHYQELIKILPEDKFQIIITGGEKESAFLKEWCKSLPPHVLNMVGKISLDQLISLLNSCDGIIAASTGPLHIASALGKYALGLFPPIRPMNPSRWAPIGDKAEFLVIDKECSDCRSKPEMCHCMNEIGVGMVVERVMRWGK